MTRLGLGINGGRPGQAVRRERELFKIALNLCHRTSVRWSDDTWPTNRRTLSPNLARGSGDVRFGFVRRLGRSAALWPLQPGPGDTPGSPRLSHLFCDFQL